jgi:hypothetical protein
MMMMMMMGSCCFVVVMLILPSCFAGLFTFIHSFILFKFSTSIHRFKEQTSGYRTCHKVLNFVPFFETVMACIFSEIKISVCLMGYNTQGWIDDGIMCGNCGRKLTNVPVEFCTGISVQ